MPAHQNSSQSSSTSQGPALFATITGAGVSAICVPPFFHPVDTIIKRWQKSELNVKKALASPMLREHIFFQDATHKSWPYKILSLYRGISCAVLNRFIQVAYITSAEKLLMHKLQGSFVDTGYQKVFGNKYKEIMLRSTVGIAVGASTIILLPLDIIKIQMMTNEALYHNIKKQGLYQHCKEHHALLYQLSAFTVLKNSVSIGTFLGTNIAVKNQFSSKDLTPQQKFLAYGAAAFVSTLIINPFDVIKTRIHSHASVLTVHSAIRQLLKTEGFLTLFKGITPKLVMKTPKLAITFGLADVFAETFNFQFGLFKHAKNTQINPDNIPDTAQSPTTSSALQTADQQQQHQQKAKLTPK